MTLAPDTLARWSALPSPLGAIAEAHAAQLRADTGVDDDDAMRQVLDDLERAERDAGDPLDHVIMCGPKAPSEADRQAVADFARFLRSAGRPR